MVAGGEVKLVGIQKGYKESGKDQVNLRRMAFG
jgi:hypothetical protein